MPPHRKHASRICATKGCRRMPRYRNVTGNLVCRLHKGDTDRNCKDARCVVIGCQRWCVYNFIGGCALFCGVHRAIGMVNVKVAFKKMTCVIPGCINSCCSGLPVCKSHKPEKIKHRKREPVYEKDLQEYYELQKLEAVDRFNAIVGINLDSDSDSDTNTEFLLDDLTPDGFSVDV